MKTKDHSGLFRGIIGHGAVTRFLETSLDLQTTTHAYLYVGPRSVGKTSVLVRFLNGLIGGARTSLDEFQTYPDFTLARRCADEKTGKPRKNITIDQIREMRTRLAMGSFLNSWKIAVVDGAEDLSTEAANALLKTLEEPTPKTVIILTASSLAGIPETIASRCQVIRFRLVPESAISRGLEALEVRHADAEQWAGVAGGRPGLAVRLATDPEERARYEDAVREGISLLAAPVHERFAAIGAALPEKASLLEAADILEAKLDVWEAMIRDGLTVSLGLADFAAARLPEVASWGRKRSSSEIAGILRLAQDVRTALRENVQPRLALERLAIAL